MIAPEIRLIYLLALKYQDENFPGNDIEALNKYIYYIQKFTPRQFIDTYDFIQAVVNDLVSNNN